MNLWLALRVPTLPASCSDAVASPLPALAAIEPVLPALRESRWGRECIRLAEDVVAGKYKLLGYDIEPGLDIPWRKDFVHGHQSGRAYFRQIPYLQFEAVGDHKIVWEMSRHQHFVLLAQAFRLSGRREFLNEALRQWSSWNEDNPFHSSIHWTSALEVAFRALSWIWLWHLAGADFPTELHAPFLQSLYAHGRHLQYNLSVYFSPNTHLLGEAVALHALGALFPSFPESAAWIETGARIVRQELDRQVLPDGAHFEQSSYYHVYALDFFLFHYLLAGRPAEYLPVLHRMADYLDALLGPAERLPLIGDDDGGRLFYPYGKHDEYGRATIATCGLLLQRAEFLRADEDFCPQAAWWLGAEVLALPDAKPTPYASKVFAGSGNVVLQNQHFWLLFRAGGFGPFRAGHSHSDALSIVLRDPLADVLVDAGTCTYLANMEQRNWFRGTAAHNTVRIDGQDFAAPMNPFAWNGRPQVELSSHQFSAAGGVLVGICRYRIGAEEVEYRRTLMLQGKELRVSDQLSGLSGEHSIEVFWHGVAGIEVLAPGRYRIGANVSLEAPEDCGVEIGPGGEHGWRSTAYGRCEESPVLVFRKRTALPVTLETVIRTYPE
jgi:hypothetical protein